MSRRVLIVRVGAMGDVLHALPAVTALRRARPDWGIDWVVDRRWASLLVDDHRNGVIVDHVHLAETRVWSKAPFSGRTLRSVGALRLATREQRYDLAVDMQGTMRSAVIARLASAKDLAGYADPREAAAGALYRRRIQRRGTHVVEQGAALLSEAAGVELEAVDVELPREAWAEHWAEEIIAGRPTCVLAASAGWGAKQWPAERFAELARELQAAGYRVLVNAGRRDDVVAGRVVDASGGAAQLAVCNVTGLIALVRRAAMVIGGDSGPVHLAAALGTPRVGLYGPTDPARNGPWGPGAKRVLRDPSSVTSHKKVSEVEAGLRRITVEQVMGAVRELQEAAASGSGGE